MPWIVTKRKIWKKLRRESFVGVSMRNAITDECFDRYSGKGGKSFERRRKLRRELALFDSPDLWVERPISEMIDIGRMENKISSWDKPIEKKDFIPDDRSDDMGTRDIDDGPFLSDPAYIEKDKIEPPAFSLEIKLHAPLSKEQKEEFFSWLECCEKVLLEKINGMDI